MTMKWIIGLIAALAVSAPTAGYAQGNAPGPAPTARQMELARELIEVSGMRNLMSTMITSMVSSMESSLPRGDTPEERKINDAVRGAAKDEFAKFVPKMIDISADLYARNYSEQELSDVLTFYKSPSGQSVLAKTPKLMQQIMVQIKPMIPQMQRDMIADMCDRLSCTPTMRAAIMQKLPAAAGPAPAP